MKIDTIPFKTIMDTIITNNINNNNNSDEGIYQIKCHKCSL